MLVLSNIHAYVLGEHGDSAFAVWSKSTIGMVPISDTVNMDDLEIIENEMKRQAYRIIDCKGYTNFGVANAILRITKAIINDENKNLMYHLLLMIYIICHLLLIKVVALYSKI